MSKLTSNAAKRWIPVLGFWAAFWASIAFAGRLPWIQGAWVAVLLIVLAAVATYSILGVRRREDGVILQRGYPRWFLRFAHDEYDEQEKQHPLRRKNGSDLNGESDSC